MEPSVINKNIPPVQPPEGWTPEYAEENLKLIRNLQNMGRLVEERDRIRAEQEKLAQAQKKPNLNLKDRYMYATTQLDKTIEEIDKHGEVRTTLARNFMNKYLDAYTIIDNLYLPAESARIDYQIIEDTIKRNALTAIQTFINSQRTPDFSGLSYATKETILDLKYQMSRIWNNLNDIVHLTISITANFMISQLMFYVAKQTIFVYIKESILRPHLHEFIQTARENIMREDMLIDIDDKKVEIINEVQEYVYAMMISMDIEKQNQMRKKLCSYRDDDRFLRIMEGELIDTDWLIPDFVRDLILFKDNSEEIIAGKKYQSFYKRYMRALTIPANEELFREFISGEMLDIEFSNKLKATIKKRNQEQQLPSQDYMLIDGITMDEMRLITKVVRGTISFEERALLAGSKYAEKIYEIIDRKGGLRIRWEIKDNNLVSYNEITQERATYDFKTSKYETDIDPYLNKFPDFIKNALYDKNGHISVDNLPDCFLFQGGFVANDKSNPAEIAKIYDVYAGSHKDKKIAQRQAFIDYYFRKYSKTKPEECKAFKNVVENHREYGLKHIPQEYINLGTKPLIRDNEHKLMGDLCELEGLYRELWQAQEDRIERINRYNLGAEPNVKKNERNEIVKEEVPFIEGLPEGVRLKYMPKTKWERDMLLNEEIERVKKLGVQYNTYNGLSPTMNFLADMVDLPEGSEYQTRNEIRESQIARAWAKQRDLEEAAKKQNPLGMTAKEREDTLY